MTKGAQRLSNHAPRSAAVLTSPCFVDPTSPFQSSRLSIARATEALAVSSTTPPRPRLSARHASWPHHPAGSAFHRATRGREGAVLTWRT